MESSVVKGSTSVDTPTVGDETTGIQVSNNTKMDTNDLGDISSEEIAALKVGVPASQAQTKEGTDNHERHHVQLQAMQATSSGQAGNEMSGVPHRPKVGSAFQGIAEHEQQAQPVITSTRGRGATKVSLLSIQEDGENDINKDDVRSINASKTPFLKDLEEDELDKVDVTLIEDTTANKWWKYTCFFCSVATFFIFFSGFIHCASDEYSSKCFPNVVPAEIPSFNGLMAAGGAFILLGGATYFACPGLEWGPFLNPDNILYRFVQLPNWGRFWTLELAYD